MPKAGGLARAADVPYAMAAVTVTATGLSGASTYLIPYTWPAGRFTAAPIAAIAHVGGTGSSAFFAILTSPPSTSGGNILVVQRDGTIAAITSITIHLIGVQMTPTSGDG